LLFLVTVGRLFRASLISGWKQKPWATGKAIKRNGIRQHSCSTSFPIYRLNSYTRFPFLSKQEIQCQRCCTASYHHHSSIHTLSNTRYFVKFGNAGRYFRSTESTSIHW